MGGDRLLSLSVVGNKSSPFCPDYTARAFETFNKPEYRTGAAQQLVIWLNIICLIKISLITHFIHDSNI